MNGELFPTDLPAREWTEFSAAGFPAPVTGVIHRGSRPPSCGMPLGGVDTGCLDLGSSGLFGFSSIFNALYPRRGPLGVPFLGLSVGLQSWALTTLNLESPDPDGHFWVDWRVLRDPGDMRAARRASEIHYWGHYPVADLEYETDAPVSINMRAWSPFVPGDVAISNTPGAVFEVHLHNSSRERQKGSLVFSFPGPSEGEALTTVFAREQLSGPLSGVAVTSERASYVLGVIGDQKVRVGGDLGVDSGAWCSIARELPVAHQGPDASVAVDWALGPGESAVVRFVLAWYSPQWVGSGAPTAGGNTYTHMYAARYASALEVARFLAQNHEPLLGRILAWQEAIYTDSTLPGWLQDSLINVLHLITETSVWAQAKPPVGAWCRAEDGIFGVSESPRICPQIECIPCSFFGNLPLVYFFPELALSTLRTYKAYQYPSGQAPWIFGGVTGGTLPYEMVLPSQGYPGKPQTTLDGPCYVDMVDRLWRCTGDNGILREFYESVKKNTIFTMNLRPGSGAAGIVSMPADNLAKTGSRLVTFSASCLTSVVLTWRSCAWRNGWPRPWATETLPGSVPSGWSRAVRCWRSTPGRAAIMCCTTNWRLANGPTLSWATSWMGNGWRCFTGWRGCSGQTGSRLRWRRSNAPTLPFQTLGRSHSATSEANWWPKGDSP